MALLLFAGFFRFSELASLTIRDISISDTHLTINVSQSKTDQYRKGNEVVISRSGKVTCPVSNLERYMTLAGISAAKVSDFLFKSETAKDGYVEDSLNNRLLVTKSLGI